MNILRSFAVIGFIVLTGCCTRVDETEVPLVPSVRQEIYDRAERPFTRAMLIKPLRKDESDPVEVKLAPFIFLEQAVATNSTGASTSTPVIQVSESKALIGTNSYSQINYVWESLPGTVAQQRRQGVRLTLGDDGDPLVWEILNDVSDAEIVFVAQSVEADAMKKLGSPLSHRRFTVECSISEMPKTVVASLVENGPAAMGPMIFVNTNGAISALTCRCMPVQADQLSGEAVFQLSKVNSMNSPIEKPSASIPKDWFDPRRLEKALRVRELVGD